MAQDLRPKCPRCGEPARWARVLAEARVVLGDDGDRTRVVAGLGTLLETLGFECGGRHKWAIQPTQTQEESC